MIQVRGEWQLAIGSEGGEPGQFFNPRGLALTPDDAFLLVSDQGNCRVVVLRATDGTWVRALTASFFTLHNPFGVTVVPSTGEVLVSDIYFCTVVRFRSINDDTVVGTLGTGQGDGPNEFDSPGGMVVLDATLCPLVLLFFLHL